ncbi:glycerophosphodiester phosphodiesterase [Metabacillus sp. GX 13764]|uniref:glycerophosphodiester phosphodiesterase n=1 Tax=Metabacillus kandeliae TaxID=2900151 RepID=UPI001E532B97|nr:glycerophosphodiester phosphodiesterase [Metabacillus kandeliae]MCD7035054.1 glycerophosphodiester phosphodiesterase [Metabacillus kandeliae]
MNKKWFGFVGTAALAIGLLSGNTALAGSKKDDGIANVAHRGASGYAPEHTMASYKLGDKLHGDFIEIDLQMTKDGKLIAMHDEQLDRTTNGTGLVKDHTLKEIKKLDAGSWFNKAYPYLAKKSYKGLKVLTLEEIFKEFGKNKNYYIETKSPEVYPGMEEKLLKTINKYHIPKKNVLIQSFSKESLLKVHKMDSSLHLVQLLDYTSPAAISNEELKDIKTYAIGIGPNARFITKEYVQNTVKSGLQIHPFTVNERNDMNKLLDWGVTGMFTNYPDVLDSLIKERSKK